MSAAGVSVTFPLVEMNAAVDATALALYQSRREMLDQIGVQLLSFTKLDYETKSHGGTGTDGIAWAPITVGTILARLRKAGHVHRVAHTSSTPDSVKATKAFGPKGAKSTDALVVKKTVKANHALFLQLHRAGVRFLDKKTGAVIKGSRPKYKAGTYIKTGKGVRKQTVSLSAGSYQIGVDTGLQRNSASPGYTAPDGKGGNVMTRTDDSITVGFGRSYSKYFDKNRKLIPDVLPVDWMTDLEEIAAGVGGKVVENALKEKGVS